VKYHFVVNPVAGRRTAVPLVEQIGAALRAAGQDVSVHVTARAGGATEHIRALTESHCDRLVVVGGDGTLHEVVNGIGAPLPWPVGIVPMGTANLVGRELHMPLNRQAGMLAKRLLGSAPWSVDLIRITHADGRREFAVANVGAGLDAEIVRAIAHLRAGAAGSGSYASWIRPILATVGAFRFPRLRVTVDGRRTFAAAACVVQNAHNYGGLLRLSPEAALDSGKLDVTLIRARTKRDLLRILTGALARRVPRFHDVKIVRAERVELQCGRRVYLQADGDPAGSTDATLEIVPKAMRLLRA